MVPFNRPIPESEDRPKSSSGLASLVQAEKMMQIAILLPCSVLVGWLIGAWLDTRLHQTWISLAGILFGGLSGLVYVVRLVIATGGNSKAGPKSGAGTGSSELKQ